MHLVLELLSETAIKHKKPFPALDWLGQASEDVFLLDGGRSCILQLSSGGTKRHALRCRTLYERLRTTVATCVSPGGAFLAGVSFRCELFAWHRDSNKLRCVQPPSDFSYFTTCSTPFEEKQSHQPSKTCAGRLLTPRLFVDEPCERAVLVRPAGGSLLVWEDGQRARWSLVTPPDHVPLPDTLCKEATVDVVFSRQSEGWARCSLVFGTEEALVVSTATLRWRPAAELLTDGQSRFSAGWSVLRLPWPQIHPRAALVRHSGALVARYSRGGRLLAVAVNQRDSDVTRLVYLGSATRAVLVADLHGAGATGVHHRHRRQYWVAGLSWLAGDALLAAVTKQGSLALLSALGEPVPLLVAGAEASSQPARYLLLHSLLTADSAEAESADGGSPLSSARSAARPLRQRYSVATHPRRPVLLCSSGYMVTLAEVKWHAPLVICDLFISSARDLLAALKRSEGLRSKQERRRSKPSTPVLKRPSAEPGRRSASSARRGRRVSFADRPHPEAAVGRREPPSESAADWRRVRTLCGRLMTAQALIISRPGRCTQEWAGRAGSVGRLARQLAAAALAGGCGRLGGPLSRLERLLPLLGRLTALSAFSDWGGNVTLAGAGVLAALLEGGLRTCRRLSAEDALRALSALYDALQSAELSQRRPDQSGLCADQLERHQASALFSVSLQAGTPCSTGAPASLSPLWQRLLRAVGRLYHRQRGRLTADQLSRLAALLGRLQARVQRQGRPLAAVRLPRRTPVLRRFLAGDWRGTEAQLLAQLEAALAGRKAARRASRPALGLLYLHVAGGRLRRALEAVDAVLLRCGASPADGSGFQLEAALRHPAGRRLLYSLARLMARFHLATPFSVQPPHDARPEPPLTSTAVPRHSVVQRELLTADISNNYLSDVWNPQQAFKMLICCGLLDEAIWFARELGDWRTALLVCVLNSQLQSPKQRLQSALSAERLLSAQAASYLPLPAASLEVSSVRRLLLAALLAGVPLVPALLAGLVPLLLQPLRQLPCLVPAEQPLPAVPLYLPAAAAANSDGGQETRARRRLAETVQKVLSVLRAAGLLERCTLHYLTALRQTCRRLECEQAFRSPTLDTSLEGTLRQLNAQLADDGDIQRHQEFVDAAKHLRYLCLLLFLLHVRDKLSITVRAAQSKTMTSAPAADSALQIVSLTATLQPLSALAGFSADLATLALDAALSVDPADQTVIDRLVAPLAETLADLGQLSDVNQQRLRRLLGCWGDGRTLPFAEGWQLAQHSYRAGSGAQKLLDGCRVQQLQPRSQLQLLSEGGWLFGGPPDPSPLEAQPPFLEFLRTALDVAAPPGLAVTPAQPLLAGWQSWHERSQLASPAFLSGYRKMVAAACEGAAKEEPMPAGSYLKDNEDFSRAPTDLGFGSALTPTAASNHLKRKRTRVSRSAEELSEAAAPVRRGLFRCVSFSDIWRPTGGDEEFFLAGGSKELRSSRKGRLRSRSADATVGRVRSRSSSRSWQTLPRQWTRSTLPELGARQARGGGDGDGNGVSLKHPALRLSRGVSVPRLDKYERVEKLMGWFLLWRHREIRMDLVKPFSGPRIALRPSMPDILVYVWLTDRLQSGQGQGRGRPAPGRGPGPGGFVTMGADATKTGNNIDTSSSDDNAVFLENEGDDPMLRLRREFLSRGRSGGHVGQDDYVEQESGYGGRGSRQYGRPSTALPGYGYQGGQREYQGDRYQDYESTRPHSSRVGNRGYDNRPYQRYWRSRDVRNQDLRSFGNQTEGQRLSGPEYGRRGFDDKVQDDVAGRRPRYGGPQYRPYDRPVGSGGRYGGSAPPAPGRRTVDQQMRHGGVSSAGRTEKWGSWDDFRAAPVSMRAGRSPSRSFSAQPSSRAGGAAPRQDGWEMHTLVPPPDGLSPQPPAGWERRERGVRQSAPPSPLVLPAGTAPGWDKTLHAVRVGAAGAQWKQMHGLDRVEGDECFMVYDDKIVRMENFTADTGATIDVVEKVAVYSPPGRARAASGGGVRAPAVPLSREPSAGTARASDGAPCVDCDWQPWSSSNLGGQRQAQSAPAMRSTTAVIPTTLQVPKSAGARDKDGCVDCGEWQHWSASTLKSATPASERAESVRVLPSERAASAGPAPSRSDMSMSRQSELSERSDLISQLSDEVRQLREEQRHLRRELAARSPPPAADVNVPQLTRIIDQINDALEVGLARLQRGEAWHPGPIHAPSSLQPYIQAMKLPAPLLNAIVYDPEWRYSSRPGSRPASRPGSVRSDVAPAVEVDAGYRRINAEQISRLVAEEVRKALREAAPSSGRSEGRQARRRPRSTSPAPVRDIIVHQAVRRTHSHDPKTAPLPTAPPDDSGADRQSSRSSSPPSVSLGAVPPPAYGGYPFLLHLEDGGAAEQMAARQLRAVQESPASRKIIQLLRDTDPAAPGGEPDLVDRVLGIHKRSLEGMYEKKTENMRVIQLLRDISEDEEKADHRTKQEIKQLDDEIATLKHTLRALDSTEKLSVWRSPSDELRYLQERIRQLGGKGPRDDFAAAERVFVAAAEEAAVAASEETVIAAEEGPDTGRDDTKYRAVSAGTGSECKVKQPRRPDGRKHTQIVYDTGQPRSPSPGRRGRAERLPGAGGHMDVDLSEEEAPPPQRVHRRFASGPTKPESSRSTPDAMVSQERPAVPLVSRSVFETTRAYQTSGEDRYIRAADLETAQSAPLAISSTTDEIEVGSYSVSEADQRDMARPITTRDALGLAEGRDVEQQMSRERTTRTGGQQTRRRSPSPAGVAVTAPVTPVEMVPVQGPSEPPVPSSTVPSDPVLRSVPSWGRQTDSATGVTSSVLKSIPSYLGAPGQQRPAAEEEHVLEIGPIQLGISPHRIVGKLADIGTRLGQAVGLVEQQQESYDEVRQVLEQLLPAPSGGSADSLQAFGSALSEPTPSMQRLLEQRLQQPSSLDVMFSAHDTPITAEECEPGEPDPPAKANAAGANSSPDPPDVVGAEADPEAIHGDSDPHSADESDQ